MRLERFKTYDLVIHMTISKTCLGEQLQKSAKYESSQVETQLKLEHIRKKQELLTHERTGYICMK